MSEWKAVGLLWAGLGLAQALLVAVHLTLVSLGEWADVLGPSILSLIMLPTFLICSRFWLYMRGRRLPSDIGA